MEERTAFAVLNIEITKEEEQIKRAYRELLSRTNPEDDPEGFKRLRTAYETACTYARKQKEVQEEGEKTLVDAWIDCVKEVYETFSKRIDSSQWEALLEDDACQDLDTAEEARDKLFYYLMEHYRLPKSVWLLLDDRFFIEEEEMQFKERLPANFIDFILGQKRVLADFPFRLFQGAEDADYDTFINQYFELYDAIQSEKLDLAKDLLETLDNMNITHPLVELERNYMKVLEGKEEEAYEKTKAILEEFPGEVRLQIPGAWLLKKTGHEEEAVRYYEELLEVIPSHYTANRCLFEYYREKQEYEKAKGFGEEALRSNSGDQKLQEELREVNEILIQEYQEKIQAQALDGKGYLDFAWCCLQNRREKEGIEVLLDFEPEEEQKTGYYSVMERLYFSDGQPQKAEEMGYLWIAAIQKEEASLKEEEQEHVPERIAAAYYIMGKAWAEAGDQDAHALECLEKSLALFQGNEDAFIQKILILKKQKKLEEAMETCNQILQHNDKSFWAYVHRMDICYEQKNGQGVLDNYHQARELFAYYPHLYETAADIFEKYGQYQDGLQIIAQAKELEIETPKLLQLKARCVHMEAKSREALEEAMKQILEILKQLETQGQCKESAEVLAEAARCSGDLRELEDALRYINQALEIKKEAIFYWIKSTVLLDGEKYQEALECLKICEEAYPDGDRVFSRIGVCYYHLDELEKAMEYQQKTLQSNPDNEQANSDILNIYKIKINQSKTKKERAAIYEQGVPYASRQLELTPEAYYYIERGLFHLEGDACEAAMEDFQKAAELEPENVYAAHNMGSALQQVREYEKALEFYQKALSLKRPEQRLGTNGKIADCLKALGRYDEALPYLLAYQKEFPKSKNIIRKLIELYTCLGNLEKALEWMSAYCGAHEKEFALEKARMYIRLESGSEAEACLKGIIKQDNKCFSAYLLLARNALYIQENNRAALKYAKKAAGLAEKGASDYYSIHTLLQELFFYTKKKRKAAAEAKLLREYLREKYGTEEQMQESMHASWCWYALGESYYYEENYEQAEFYFQKIQESGRCRWCEYGRCLDYLQAYGLLLASKGDIKEAKHYFEESLKENPLDLQGLYARRTLEKYWGKGK